MNNNTFPKLPLESHFIPAVNKGWTTGDKLMLVLHGRGDTLHSYKVLTQEINVTGLNYLLLNAPFVEFFGYTWYDDSFRFDDDKYIHSLRCLEETYKAAVSAGYLPEDIFLFGFSQGGRMVIDLLKRLNVKLGGVVALSPRVSHYNTEEFTLSDEAKKTPLYVAHGERDPVIPAFETEENLQVWKLNIENFSFKLYPMEHEIDIMELVHLRDWLNDLL